MVILLWGIPGDEPMACVHREIERRGLPSLFLDQQAVLDSTMELCVGRDVRGTLAAQGQSIALEAITAAYLRPYDTRRMRAIADAAPESPDLAHALGIEDMLIGWAELTPARVVNRPSAMASNNAKPYQLALIRSLGMETPATLVTTDVDAALAFWEAHRAIVYKSVSGVRSIVSRLTPAHRDRLRDIVTCPTQFQEYIDGNDIRVHVVGDDVFACEIRSEATDYRYAGREGAEIAIRACDLPPEVAARCIAVTAALGLHVAGIDLRRTPAGEWYCFEVNPSPGFTFYEEATGQPIGAAIAAFLSS